MLRAVVLSLMLLSGAVEAAAARPIVIAHRGASGERPEHTESAYVRGIEEGADFIEPDLVLTRDGVFVARHENEISGTTDVASRPEFAARRATKTIDGEAVTGWFTEDFTLAELKTLRARERLPQLRPSNVAYDGQDPILTFEEVVAIARREGAARGRVVGVYPELKHPTYFRGIGQPMEERFVAELKRLGLDAKDAPVFVQCFEPGTLQRLRKLTRAPLVFLMSSEGAPVDLAGTGDRTTYADFLTDEGLKRVAEFADAIGADKALVLARKNGASAGATDLPLRAHAQGLKVHVWTFRPENYFLPDDLRRGNPKDPAFLRMPGDIDAELRQAFDAGVDGVFADVPGLAVEVLKTRR